MGPTDTIQSVGLQEAGACSMQSTYLQVAWVSKLVETIAKYLSSFSGSVLVPGEFWFMEKNEKQSKPLALRLPRNICCRNLLTFIGTNPPASAAVRHGTEAEDRPGDSLSSTQHFISPCTAPWLRCKVIALLCVAYLLGLAGAGLLQLAQQSLKALLKKS